MKVGILTFHNAYNYGAILQCYATQELVKAMGHEAVVIDYHNKKIDSVYNGRKFNFRTFVRYFYKFPLYLLEISFYRMRRNAYCTFFRRYICLSSAQYLQEDIKSIKGYDAILIGSDQLWNKRITGGLDPVYWGDFVSEPHTRKIAWSICMNNDDFTSREEDYIIKNLNNFSAISVREKSLQVFLKELTHKDYPQTLDPTLLLSKKQWEKLCHPVAEKDYIAVYAVGFEKETIEFARQVARKLNKKILIIRAYSKHYMSKENKEYCGPDDFLSYIRYSDFVVTTSFHGTALSIIFDKQFVCPVFNDNTRINSLLTVVDLNARLVRTPEEALSLPSINYDNVDELLEQERVVSRHFLEVALSCN